MDAAELYKKMKSIGWIGAMSALDIHDRMDYYGYTEDNEQNKTMPVRIKIGNDVKYAKTLWTQKYQKYKFCQVAHADSNRYSAFQFAKTLLTIPNMFLVWPTSDTEWDICTACYLNSDSIMLKGETFKLFERKQHAGS